MVSQKRNRESRCQSKYALLVSSLLIMTLVIARVCLHSEITEWSSIDFIIYRRALGRKQPTGLHHSDAHNKRIFEFLIYGRRRRRRRGATRDCGALISSSFNLSKLSWKLSSKLRRSRKERMQHDDDNDDDEVVLVVQVYVYIFQSVSILNFQTTLGPISVT